MPRLFGESPIRTACPSLTSSRRTAWRRLPHWVESHENQLRNVRHHEVVVLDGGHYLHWTQSEAMAAKITAFLDENLQR